MSTKFVNRWFFFVVIFLMTTGIRAQSSPSIAVLPLHSNGISPSEALVLTDELRSVMVQSAKYTVVERNNMESILKEQGFQMSGCTSSECAVEAGKLLGVQKMVAGSVGKLGEIYNINLRLFDVATGKIDQNISQKHEGSIEGLLDVIRELGYKLSDTSPTGAKNEFGIRKSTSQPAGNRIGLWLGVNFPQTSNLSNAKGGLAAGLFYKARLVSNLYLQPEVSYAGSEMEYYEPDDILSFQFLQLAVLFSYEISSSASQDFFLNVSAGPALNLIISAEEAYGGYVSDIKSEVNSNQLLGIVGIGFGFTIGKVVLIVDGRYETGFDPLFTNDTDWEVGKLQAFYVLLGISF